VAAPWRKPLVIMSPKSLLRHPLAVSSLEEIGSGGFATVLDDPQPPSDPQRVLLCSGKVYYQLLQRRQELRSKKIAIVRLEQLHPFPEAALAEIVTQYGRDAEWIWVQEEPRNMGAWDFIRGRIAALIGKHLRYVGRDAAASPASGFPRVYQKEQSAITDIAVGAISESASVAG
jgi:2-oxoglutarate dehydrogenase E1 component